MPDNSGSGLQPAARQVLEFLDGLRRLANKGTSGFLLGLGALVILLAFATKLSVPWIHVLTTQPLEFVVMMLVGMVIVLSGAVFAFHAYRSELDTYGSRLEADDKPPDASSGASASPNIPSA